METPQQPYSHFEKETGVRETKQPSQSVTANK